MPEKRGIISNLRYIMAIMIETAPLFLILTVLKTFDQNGIIPSGGQ